MWKWSNFLHDTIPANKRPLHINVDESSIKLDTGSLIGNITAVSRKRKRSHKGLHRRAPKSDSRTAYTYVGIICDNQIIRQELPQFIVLNKRICSEAVYRRLLAQVPSKVKVLRAAKSSWLTNVGFCKIIRSIAQHLRPFVRDYQPILSLDAASIHLHSTVWSTVARSGLLMHCIPAKATYCLQPLDVYSFALLKGEIKQRCQAHNIASGTVDLEASVLVLAAAAHKILYGRCWRNSFSHLGLTGNQSDVSERLLAKIDATSVPLIPRSDPTLEDFAACFPKRRIIPLDSIFECVVKLANRNQRIPLLGLPRLHRLHAFLAARTVRGHLAPAPAGGALPVHPVLAVGVAPSVLPCPTMIRLRRLPSQRVQEHRAPLPPPAAPP